MREDMNGRVAEYRGLVESSARKFAASDRAIRLGVDFDDLVQEGLIDVWQTLERGRTPSASNIENRMRDWMRHVARQRGMYYTEEDADEELHRVRAQHFSYDNLLPLDGLRVRQPQE